MLFLKPSNLLFLKRINFKLKMNYSKREKNIPRDFPSINYGCLLLTEFEVRTVSYGPSFFPFDLLIVGGKRGSVTYSTDRQDEVSKIFIISLLCVWRVRQQFPFMRNGFKFLKQVESKTNQFEIVFKSLAHFSTQFRVIESFKLLFAL